MTDISTNADGVLVSIPVSHSRAYTYAVRTVLSDWLGLRCEFTTGRDGSVEIRPTDASGSLLVPASLSGSEHRMDEHDLRASVKLSGASLKGPGSFPFDIFGVAYALLTQQETREASDRDCHGRVLAASTVMGCRPMEPILDEAVELMWRAMVELWPRISRRHDTFQIVPTHDVDVPYLYATQDARQVVRTALGQLVKKRSPTVAIRTVLDWVRVRTGKLEDPGDTLDLIMDISEQAGLRSAFYFTIGDGRTGYDFRCPLTHPLVQSLVKRVHERGHEIGFHPGYATAMDPETWRAEWRRFRTAIPAEIPIDGGRQHYLRFSWPDTWRCWEDAGLTYDSTLTFADHPGFRAGTCRSFRLYDTEHQCPLQVEERPTVLMDSSLTDEPYMGLGTTERAYTVAGQLKEACRRHGGRFTLLWHNSRFGCEGDVEIYKWLIDG